MNVLKQPTNRTAGLWSRLSPKHKQWVVIAGVIGAFVLIAYPMINSNAPPATKKQSIPNILTGADTRELGIGGIAHQLQNQQAEIADLKKQLDAKDKAPASDGQTATGNAQYAELAKRLEAAEKTLQQQQNEPHPAVVSGATGTTPVGQGTMPQSPTAAQGTLWSQPPVTHPSQTPAGTVAPGTASPPPAPMKIRTIDSDSDAKAGATPALDSKKDEQKAYIPSGAMLSGVMITGLDAATGRSSTQDPIPVLVRIKHEAILPNRYRADVKECFVVAAGYGDLSSERAYLRAENISCVRKDGKVIDSKVEMYAVGEDGKAGMRGHLISKQGQAIAKAAVAGFAQAYAQALRPQYGTALVTGSGATQAFTADQVENGFAGGASSALDRVSKFYIDMANQMFPVVEVDAGREITFVTLRGSELALEGHR